MIYHIHKKYHQATVDQNKELVIHDLMSQVYMKPTNLAHLNIMYFIQTSPNVLLKYCIAPNA